MKPGEYILREEPIIGNEGGKTRVLNVTNLGDRPIQVGSHYHFAEVNQSLDMDRVAARGFRLDIPAGTAVRFEPGDARSVHLVELAGNHEVYGLQNLVNGSLGDVVPAVDTEAIGGTAGITPLAEPDVAAGYEIDTTNVGHDNIGFHTTYGWDPLDPSRGPRPTDDGDAPDRGDQDPSASRTDAGGRAPEGDDAAPGRTGDATEDATEDGEERP